ncbi:hypothetical protein ACP4OV_018459 [Aristida adscensionis]
MGTAKTATSWLCCPCRCVFRGVVGCVVGALTCVVLAAGLAALALYLFFRPHLVQATAVAAELPVFALTARTWILRYNASVALHLRNPNRRIAVDYYRGLAAHAFYEGQRFADNAAPLPPFFQGTGETTPLALAFAGRSPLVGGVAAAGFRREAAEGATFSVAVKLDAHTRLRVWAFTVAGPKAKIDCPLRIKRRNATAPAGAPPPEFTPTKCRVWF